MTQTNPFVRAGWYTALGINFSGTIAGGAAVGWMIDRWLGSAPLALLTCTVLGLVGGFVWLVHVLRRFKRWAPGPGPWPAAGRPWGAGRRAAGRLGRRGSPRRGRRPPL